MEKGVAQGSVLSPQLFNVYLDHVIRNNTKLDKVRRISDILAYADDLSIFAGSKSEAVLIIKEDCDQFQAYGLMINVTKSEIL